MQATQNVEEMQSKKNALVLCPNALQWSNAMMCSATACTQCSTSVQCIGVPAKLKSLIGPTIAKCTSDGGDDDDYYLLK